MINHNLDIDIKYLDCQFINNVWQPSKKELIPLISPSTEQKLADVGVPSIEEADLAIKLCREAFDNGPWPHLTIKERVKICETFCNALESRLPELNRAWALESGPTLSHAEIINDQVGVAVWRQMLKTAPGLSWEEQRDDALLLREPIGTVLSIMTFNGPIVLIGMKIIPALLAGCTVIGKHAPESQLTSRLISEAIEDSDIPTGVLTLLAADTDVTQHMVSHSSIDMVSLTGGTDIGIDVVKKTADRLARTCLELGGKSPAIILEDADLEDTLDTLVPGSTSFMGQVCVNLSRILVPRSRQDEIIDALASKYNSLKIGDPLLKSSQQGPLAVLRGLERTEYYVSLAKDQGAQVVTGGKRPSGFDTGWWYEPTLLKNTENSMNVVREEIFGPVTSVTAYDKIEDAISLANDSDFGLAASIYGKDDELLTMIAKKLQSGSVAINTAGISFMQPFGGYKKSGWGKECGDEGILEFTQIKQIIRG
tara:strand:- start:1926 stop:3371 length:1446 start_codon:yes stop_codon:yes gene_type:complete